MFFACAVTLYSIGTFHKRARKIRLREQVGSLGFVQCGFIFARSLLPCESPPPLFFLNSCVFFYYVSMSFWDATVHHPHRHYVHRRPPSPFTTPSPTHSILFTRCAGTIPSAPPSSAPRWYSPSPSSFASNSKIWASCN